jgi:hypothetical protein
MVIQPCQLQGLRPDVPAGDVGSEIENRVDLEEVVEAVPPHDRGLVASGDGDGEAQVGQERRAIGVGGVEGSGDPVAPFSTPTAPAER